MKKPNREPEIFEKKKFSLSISSKMQGVGICKDGLLNNAKICQQTKKLISLNTSKVPN